ncbi:hypothetical protein KAI87_15185, partial [Myxococcota bacterium]|nr:hypothetical protein [Myxococcota bacterium]
ALPRDLSEAPAADHLVVQWVSPLFRGGEMQAIARSVLSFIQQARSEGYLPAIVVDCWPVAANFMVAMRELGVHLEGKGRLKKLLPTIDSAPDGLISLSAKGLPQHARVARIESGWPATSTERKLPVAATFRVAFWADWQSLARVQKACGARYVTCVGATQAPEWASAGLGEDVQIQWVGAPKQLELV